LDVEEALLILPIILKPLIAKLRAQNSSLPTAILEILGTIKLRKGKSPGAVASRLSRQKQPRYDQNRAAFLYGFEGRSVVEDNGEKHGKSHIWGRLFLGHRGSISQAQRDNCHLS